MATTICQSQPHGKQMTTTRPQTIDYDDYRIYLRELVAYLRDTTRGFSFRKFSRKAGYQSPNFLKLVIQGQRNISEDSIKKFSKAFELTSSQEIDFGHLVRFNQSKSDLERNKNYQRLKRHRPGPAAEMHAAQYDVYSKWYTLPIRELSTIPGFKEDPDWIASQFIQDVTPHEAQRSLDLLQKIGLLVRNTSGKLTAAAGRLRTGAEVPLAVRNFHRAMLKQSQDSLDGISKEERHVSSLTQALTQAQYEEVCQRVDAFREDLLQIMEDVPASHDDAKIYFVGFEIIPLTRPQTRQDQEPYSIH
jgi:uncharacterized protein (TIGR02147 family)